MMTHFTKLIAGLPVFLIFLLCSFDVWAIGSLKFICKTDLGRQIISINEENNVYTGNIQEGLTILTPVKAVYKSKVFSMSVGDNEFNLDRIDLGEFISFGGVIQDERGLSAMAENNGSQWHLSGTIENAMGQLVDFEAIADDRKGTFELTWEGKSLYLKKIPGSDTGECKGSFTKEDSERIGRFWCSSSGTLKDAFFNNPDQILAWIIILFVN